MKKIYFACSIAGGRDHVHLYGDIVDYIKACGVSLSSEMFADKVLKPEVGVNLDPAFVWQRDIKWVKDADAIVAEVTQPSLGVGYEIALAEQHQKPVLALFNTASERRLSPMIAGNPNIQIVEYKDVEELEKQIKNFVASI